MSQNDLVIANQTFPATRADITSALQALGSTNSGATAPSTTYANMMWYDTTSHILKLRSEANDVWINIGYVDQSSDTFKILDDTTVATTAGTTTGLLGNQTTATWETGTGTTESLVSPAKVKAAAASEIARSVVNFGTTYSQPSRAGGNTPYQNTGDTHMVIYIDATGNADVLSVSPDGSTWYNVYYWAGGTGVYERAMATLIVPPNHYYRFSGSSYIGWVELT